MVRIVGTDRCSVKTAGSLTRNPSVPIPLACGRFAQYPLMCRPAGKLQEGHHVVGCRRAALALVTSFATIACDSTEPLPPAVLVAPASLTLQDGESAKLTAKLRNPKT